MLVKIWGERKVTLWYQKISRALRLNNGKINQTRLKFNQSKLRPRMRVVLDSQLSQICNFERAGWLETSEENGNSFGHFAPFNPKFPELLKRQVPALYSIAELARMGELEFVRIPTIETERRQAPDKHFPAMFCVPLDHDVRYSELEFSCAKMTFQVETRWTPLSNRGDQNCHFDSSKYQLLHSHLSGKGQRKDAWHYMLCDYFGIDVFLTADKKFLEGFQQIEARLNGLGVRTKAMTPDNFCLEAKLRPTDPIQADPKAMFHPPAR